MFIQSRGRVLDWQKKGVAMDFVIQPRTEGEWEVIEVQGEVDMFTAPKLRESLTQAADAGKNRIVVDLTNVSFMDSTGLGTLVGGLKRVKENDGILALVCTHRPVLRVLSITGLTNVFPIHDTLQDVFAR
jgi:anti-sigma B factor antagonist